VLRLTLAMEPDSVPAARHALDRWSDVLDKHVLESARLLTSELVTSCVTPLGQGTGDIEFEVRITTRAIHVAVSRTVPRRGPASGHPVDGLSLTLHLLGQLADRWGLRRAERTTLWFELDRI
jgi:hypothetical protein